MRVQLFPLVGRSYVGHRRVPDSHMAMPDLRLWGAILGYLRSLPGDQVVLSKSSMPGLEKRMRRAL